MSRQLTDDDAFVLASCMSNQLASAETMISPHEIQILIAHLDRVVGLNPTEKTEVFLARQDLFFSRYRKAARHVCELLLKRAYQHGHNEECGLANKGFERAKPNRRPERT